MAVMAVALGDPQAVVLQPVANMYSAASDQADVVSQAIYNSPVVVTEERGGWFKVRTADDYTGWMKAAALRRLSDGEQPFVAGRRVASAKSLFANLYAEPDVTKHQPLLTVPFETRFEVVAEPPQDPRWVQVRLASGGAAWIQRGDLNFSTAPMSLPSVVALSRRFLGLPYLWGGTSTFGYDCSGFMQMLCRRMGLTIPRDADPQSKWSGSTRVARKDLRPGDFVFFGKSAQKVTHTGMYLGGGEFISATTHEQPVIRVDRLDDPYWSQLFVAARRLK